MAPLRVPEATATTAAGAPAVPVPAPSSLPPLVVAESDTGTPGEERVVDDLDEFFAALRQVVHDAREQIALDEPHSAAIDSSTQPVEAFNASRVGEIVPGVADPVVSNTPAFASSTELAPSTAELVASLEADRDLWRERAVVWRERALGADMLVKALNEHTSDLQINLEDLRLAMRVLANKGAAAPEPRAELPAPDLGWSGRPTEREVEAGPQE